MNCEQEPNSEVFTTSLRQAVGGTQSVWNNVTGEHWMFMKEISSDGDVSTVSIGQRGRGRDCGGDEVADLYFATFFLLRGLR